MKLFLTGAYSIIVLSLLLYRYYYRFFKGETVCKGYIVGAEIIWEAPFGVWGCYRYIVEYCSDGAVKKYAQSLEWNLFYVFLPQVERRAFSGVFLKNGRVSCPIYSIEKIALFLTGIIIVANLLE